MVRRGRWLFAAVGFVLAVTLLIVIRRGCDGPRTDAINPDDRSRLIESGPTPPPVSGDAQLKPDASTESPAQKDPAGPTVVYGVVTDRATGHPLPAARVALLGGRESFESPPPVLGQAHTNTSGQYRMEIRWLDDRAFGFAVERDGMAQALVDLGALQLVPGTTLHRDLAVDILPSIRDFPVTVRGRWARGDPADGVRIRAAWQGAEGDGSTEGTTGPNGEFSFVAAGVVQNGWIRVTASVRSGREVSANWGAPPRLAGYAGELVLPDDTAWLEVVMVDPNGTPVNVPVTYKLLGYSGSPSLGAGTLDVPRTTDARGVDGVQVPAPAHYEVHELRAPGWRQDLRALAATGRLVLAPGARETLTVRCEPARALSVRVVGPRGAVVSARVTAGILDSENDTGRTDRAGHVLLRLPTHSGRLHVSAEVAGHRVAPREMAIDYEGALPEIVLRAMPVGTASIVVELAPAAEPLPLNAPVGVAVYRLPRTPGDGPVVSRHVLSYKVHVGGLEDGARYDVLLGAMTTEPSWARGVTASAEPSSVRLGPLRPTTTVCRGAVMLPNDEPGADDAAVHVFGMPGSENDGLRSAGTITAGRFECPCPPGIYRVQLAHAEWEGWVENVSVPGPDVLIHAAPRRTGPDPFRMNIRIQIVDVATGEGVPDAQVELTDLNAPPRVAVEDADRPHFFAHTIGDARGRAFYDFWGQQTSFRARVRAPGYREAEVRLEPPFPVTRIALQRE